MRIIERFLADRRGATAVEYALIIGVLSLAAVAGFGKVADALQFLFGSNESKLQQAINS